VSVLRFRETVLKRFSEKPMPAPVSMCLIVRDEPLLEQALACVRPHVAEIVVVVTSAADTESIETAKKYGCVVEVNEECNRCVHGIPGLVHEQCPGENVLDDKIWDYSKARNRSFELATQPWLLWMDADDIIAGMERLPEVIQWADMLRQGRDVSIHFPYEYSVTDQGHCNMLLTRERLLHGKSAWRWMDEIHEIIVPVTGISLGEDERLVWKHQRHLSKPKTPKEGTRNLRILRKTYAQRPQDPRVIFYLANGLKDAGLLDEAVAKYAEYLPKSGNDDERAIACMYAAGLSIVLGKLEDAVEWGLRCVSIQEQWGEGYFLLCKAFYLLAHRKDWRERRYWEKCVYFGLEGLKKPPTKTALFIDPTVRTYEIHLWLHFARNAIGDFRGAIESTGVALESRPDDMQTRYNRLIYEEVAARADAIEALHRMLGANREIRDGFKHARPADLAYEAIERALNNPQALLEGVETKPYTNGVVETQVHEARSMVEAQVKRETDTVVGTQGSEGGASRRLDIVIACGDCWEEWSPVTAAEHGIGGSETAVIEMSKRFAARGHRVRVYTSCIPGTYDGVEWHRSAEMAGIGRCDALIAWRNAPLLELPCEARVRWLWVHDVFAVSATRENMARADRVLALSEWHKGYLLEYHAPCGLTADKVWVTRNGIDLKRFEQEVTRDPHKCVYSSSADRGLESLLQMWPRIRAAVPDASLSVMYGFANWEKMAAQRGDQESLRRIDRIKGALNVLKSAGVTYHGRVSGAELAREYLSASVFSYPTWWSETSCIGAMEAQAAGLILITSPIAALKETVANRGVMIEGDWMSKEYQDTFVATTIGALTGQGPQVEKARQALRRYAWEHFSWEGVCDSWEGALGVPKVVETQVLQVVEAGTKAYEGVL
jgi:glycosyltransferase involved in cell wall biosynthesis